MTAEKWDTIEGTTLAAAGLIRGLGGFMIEQAIEAGRDVKSHVEHRHHVSRALIGNMAIGHASSELIPSA